MPQTATTPGRSPVLPTEGEEYSPPIAPLSKAPLSKHRPYTKGKFLFAGGEKFYARGVTYGTFRPDPNGCDYRTPSLVERDFRQMASNGINAVRTYTVPPRWLLDAAEKFGLRVMIGLPWEQHVTFLDEKRVTNSIEESVVAGVRSCAGHRAVLCYAIGNEIPSQIVRWYGARRVGRFIKRLYAAAKATDPESLVTYVNYPTTEYLELSFLDLLSFNVYLESRARYETYLTRLQNIAGDKPLVIAEIGLDSRRHGRAAQAQAVDWQVRATFAGGAAGAFVFAWSDEWHRGGHTVEDWDFGLTDRNNRPKPALSVLRKSFAESPFPPGLPWPRVSVVVCSYNGSQTIRDCLEGLKKLEYPNYEVIIVDDGSTDATATIARECGFRVISTPNRGLSSARNTGIKAADGEIVAYIDDDAYPDAHWLTYLASTFMTTDYAGVGGPNLAPPEDGFIARCVANAPGGPVHVLLSDQEAEHIPGCNMAFRKVALESIGGFDQQFRVAGDDVDICWQLQQRDLKLGFSPAAVVWHHRRNSVRAYWRQQKGYGRAEAILEKKWPEKYNELGHMSWCGRVYDKALAHPLLWSRARIYHGTWGSAPFQSIYQPATNLPWSLVLMPEWYLIIFMLAALASIGIVWKPMLFALPLLALSAGLPIARAIAVASRGRLASASVDGGHNLKFRALVALLHLLQPLARLSGRLRHGLHPWRLALKDLSFVWPRTLSIWSEQWRSAEDRLRQIEKTLRALEANVVRSGDYDRWDIEVRGGLLGGARMRMAIEEHGAGKQMVRTRLWPKCSAGSILLVSAFALLGTWAAADRARAAATVFGGIALLAAVRTYLECAATLGASRKALRMTDAGRRAAQSFEAEGRFTAKRRVQSSDDDRVLGLGKCTGHGD